MIRSRYPHFLHLKKNHRSNQTPWNKKQPDYPSLMSQPYWYEEYHTHKEDLREIESNSINIGKLTDSYEQSPTVYSLKQLQRLLDVNTALIEKIDQWANQNNHLNRSSLSGWEEIQKNIKKDFIMRLSQHIMIIMQSRKRVDAMANRLNQSFHSNRSNNISMNSPHFQQNVSFTSSAHNMSHNYSFNNDGSFRNQNQSGHNNSFRQEQFDHVSKQIQRLNELMKRMNTVVVGQGELINRIDQNLMETQSNMRKGRNQLERRLQKERGQGQFSIYGRINKAIMCLYIINLILIGVFLLKNILL